MDYIKISGVTLLSCYICSTMTYGAYISYKMCIDEEGTMKQGYVPAMVGTTIFQPIMFPITSLTLAFDMTRAYHYGEKI